MLVEEFYRSKGIEPTQLQPPSPAVAALAAASAAPPPARARLSDPILPTEAMIGLLGRSASGRMAGPGQGPGMPGVPPAMPAMAGGGRGGGGAVFGGVGGGGGVIPHIVQPAPPQMIGGEGGGEILELLRAARCLHHLERFERDQLDGEVLLEMERREFERMGVTEVSFALF